MKPSDLLQIARDLASVNTRRPRRTDLCRAVSSSYYALFHCLAKCCADRLAGPRPSNTAWQQTYRALEHGATKSRCEHQDMRRFPASIQDFGDMFVEMQRKRQTADYDPEVRFRKADVIYDIDRVARVLERFSRVAAKDQRAFAIYVLLRRRRP